MHFSDPDFWTATGGVAAGVAALTTIVISAWWRRIDRPSAEWLIFDGSSEWFDDPPTSVPSGLARLDNCGSGPGFRVKIEGNGCAVGGFSVVPVFHPGTDPPVYLVFNCEPRCWNEASFTIRWLQSSSWRKRRRERSKRFWLSDIAKRPTYSARILDEEKGVINIVPQPEPEGDALPEETRPAPPSYRLGAKWQRRLDKLLPWR